MMNLETQIRLNKYQPRPYQLPLLDAIENKGYKRVMAILPRRAGKDITAFNLMIRAAIKKVGVYFYIFPTYSSGRKILWDSITNDGQRILDYINSELIESRNEQQMRIRLINGSVIQIIGSDNYDNSLVGTNPIGIVFSEYALTDPRAYQFVRPILNANAGWVVFISTPRGKNHLWELWNIAINNPSEWFAYKLTVEDTKHISIDDIEKERLSGEMSEDLIQQEYYTSFTMGVEGAYYAKYIDRMRLAGQIGRVPWDPSFMVNTSFDIGVNDSTCIIFYQVIGQTIRIIDCYEKNKEGLEHYVKLIKSKEYTYGKHFAPHDISVREFGSGMTRLEKAANLGLKFEFKVVNDVRRSIIPNLSIEDGIESVRSSFGKIWIDEERCAPLIKALENYRQEFDVKKKVYKNQPLHDWSSHYADAMRYLCLSLPKTRDGLSAQDLDKNFAAARYGNQGNLPPMFRDRASDY